MNEKTINYIYLLVFVPIAVILLFLVVGLAAGDSCLTCESYPAPVPSYLNEPSLKYDGANCPSGYWAEWTDGQPLCVPITPTVDKYPGWEATPDYWATPADPGKR